MCLIRNGTICFDNIEIPERLLKKEDRKAFIKKILFIYQQASTDLLEKENKVYQKLLDEGKISEEEIYSMKLSKVTVGMGYNDIKDAIVLELEKDFESVKPHAFRSVIDFSSNLYLDSREQYILKESPTDEKRVQTEASPLYTYHDIFTIYSEENMDIYKKQVLFEMLEEEIDDDENLFEELEDIYEIKKREY